VRIGEVEGIITELGVLSTRVVTPKKEEVTIPNAVLVQDAFNEFGIQIMSPHFEFQPAEHVFVPKTKWHDAPAVTLDRPEGGSAKVGGHT
jgi:Mechanosensitive ion channel